jgi:hypothetical protein
MRSMRSMRGGLIFRNGCANRYKTTPGEDAERSSNSVRRGGSVNRDYIKSTYLKHAL